ncbi:MAG: NAD-dependent malic enzyme [Nitrospira sp. OLB3]|nr:MAG: NAD-dependent malic enzyme [Nitrospira sp. OLB3]RIK60541.1 MAG: malate dehydrogenase [Nitrospira sp.]
MTSKADLLAKALKPAEEALRLHAHYKGKMQSMPKCAVRSLDDFALWYTPGVAAPCKAIQADPDRVFDYTNRGNTIAVVSDGTRVLGLGDIGPEAALPVMEGKALLFKYLGGVDAVPICLKTKDPNEVIRTVLLLAPSFGAINLEDIAMPKCFHVLRELQARCSIPVWHDDQQGTGTVLLAGLMNALQVVGKELGRVRIAMIGMGAANVPVYRFLTASGADPARIVACDLGGILGTHRREYECDPAFAEQWRVCLHSNPDRLKGGIAEALRGADICVAFSAGGIIKPEWVRGMARDAVVFACANPVPEIWPWEAKEAGARIVATGRSDFPNQVNNSLVFPGIFRGVLDVRARTITDEMAMAAAHELALCARERGIHEESILPTMEEWHVPMRLAVATATKAQEQGLAQVERTSDQIHILAESKIRSAHEAMKVLLREGLIVAPPAP